MNDAMHDRLRDRMPDVARGSATWTAEEAVHLAACEECRAELALLGIARRIGAEVEAGFDGSAAARGVTMRLRQAPAPAAKRYRPFLLLAAAAAAVLLLVGRPGAPATVTTPGSEVRFLPELDSLTLDELTQVADAFDAPLTDTPLIEGLPAADLDTIQLQRVLRSLEG